ncbi:hypothetical protein pb186bvf_001969 [Paramecium bursaria]
MIPKIFPSYQQIYNLILLSKMKCVNLSLLDNPNKMMKIQEIPYLIL